MPSVPPVYLDERGVGATKIMTTCPAGTAEQVAYPALGEKLPAPQTAVSKLASNPVVVSLEATSEDAVSTTVESVTESDPESTALVSDEPEDPVSVEPLEPVSVDPDEPVSVDAEPVSELEEPVSVEDIVSADATSDAETSVPDSVLPSFGGQVGKDEESSGVTVMPQ
jgi:hypothetical protein